MLANTPSRKTNAISQQACLTRPSLYKALSEDGQPEFATVLKVIRALGLKLKIAA